MKYTVLTLFPQLIQPWTEEALLGRAAKAGLVSFDVRDLRDYAGNRHRRVDERHLRVRFGAEHGRRAREQFGVGSHLGVNLQPNHDLPVVGLALDAV